MLGGRGHRCQVGGDIGARWEGVSQTNGTVAYKFTFPITAV